MQRTVMLEKDIITIACCCFIGVAKGRTRFVVVVDEFAKTPNDLFTGIRDSAGLSSCKI